LLFSSFVFNSFDTVFPLDKSYKKNYNGINTPKNNKNVFDDTFANSALDYLYSNDNLGKTQSFLENNGFPSIEERQYNKESYGAADENRQPTGKREKNVGHPDGEDHSRVPKGTGGQGVRRAETQENIGNALIGRAAAMGAGYLMYKGLRLLPSLLPPLWWTIPGNLLIP